MRLNVDTAVVRWCATADRVDRAPVAQAPITCVAIPRASERAVFADERLVGRRAPRHGAGAVAGAGMALELGFAAIALAVAACGAVLTRRTEPHALIEAALIDLRRIADLATLARAPVVVVAARVQRQRDGQREQNGEDDTRSRCFLHCELPIISCTTSLRRWGIDIG